MERPTNPCDLCDKVFYSQQALAGHQKSHRNDRRRLRLLLETPTMSDELEVIHDAEPLRAVFPCSYSTKSTNARVHGSLSSMVNHNHRSSLQRGIRHDPGICPGHQGVEERKRKAILEALAGKRLEVIQGAKNGQTSKSIDQTGPHHKIYPPMGGRGPGHQGLCLPAGYRADNGKSYASGLSAGLGNQVQPQASIGFMDMSSYRYRPCTDAAGGHVYCNVAPSVVVPRGNSASDHALDGIQGMGSSDHEYHRLKVGLRLRSDPADCIEVDGLDLTLKL